MTQTQSIQQNIHYAKKQLHSVRVNFIPRNELEKLQKQATEAHYISELKDLKFCLNAAIKNINH